MKRYQKVMVATDFSSQAAVAVELAGRLAAAWGARLVLANALLPERYAAEMLPGTESNLMAQLQEAAHKELEGVRSKLLEGVDVELAAIEGETTAMALVEHAGAHDVDLIVVGTHGRTGIARMLIGSVAEAVNRLAPCDVLTVPPHTDVASIVPPRAIVAATDLSELATLGVGVAADLARAGGSALTLFHVVETEAPVLPVAAYEGGDSPAEARWEALTAYRADHLADLEDVATEVRQWPSAADAVCRYAATQPADLIVVTTHGRTGLRRLLLGSVAERVVRHATCPVLVVRRRDTKDDDA